MNSFKISSVLLACTTLAVLLFVNVPSSSGQVTGGGGSAQYLKFYNSSGCQSKGLESSINSTDYNLTLTNVVSMAVNGMWEVGFCKLNDTSTMCSSSASLYMSSEGACVLIDPRLTNNNSTNIQAIRYGDLYQSNGTISLFGSAQFTKADPKSPVDTRGLNLTSGNSMPIGSWYFTGNHEWGLYEGVNYTGKETCLKPSNDVISNGYGFTYELVPSSLTIRSVGYRCTGGTSGAYFLKSGLISLSFIFLLGVCSKIFWE